ncbi:cache domain-containing protein [Ideonella sp. A 288]|uniref:sensor histidine kinase n=1 Tax=Ideonella sp. A 288 TaxID=1962181 RepID=UPI001F2BD458|nr:cache domain-containing protein [Ideonella sp. A 288]
MNFPQALARQPIRTKLLAMVLMPLVVVLPLLGLVLAIWGNAALDRLLITKVRADLAIAHGYFDRVLGEVAAGTSAVADSHALHEALTARASPEALQALLDSFRQRERLDFVHLRAVDGQAIASDFSTAPGPLPLLPAPRPGDRVRATVEVLAPSGQALLSPALRERVPVPLVPTRNALPTERTHEDRAMVVVADAPVRTADGTLVARVQAGMLLNRNLGFIDHINEIVYPEGSLPFGSRGTATLFLDDVRISTNVRLFGTDPSGLRRASDASASGEARAIGTRVSQAVRHAVLSDGRTWLDRAFVVSDWYVSGYEPIADGAGRRVGMLYVGYLEQPFTWMKYGVLAGIGVAFFGVMILAAMASARWARGISQPLERMALTMQQVEHGDLEARVGPVDSGDEIGALAGHLDQLLDAIDDKTGALQRGNAELDAKVAERTRALETAQQQLVRTEKMAAVGQLTASIAHEVNNPIAVIQGNLDLVRELLGADAARVAPELKLVDQQIERMRLIVTQLLQFARPSDFAGYVEEVDTARVIDDCGVLVGHLLAKTRIGVLREYAARRRPSINRNELQQVLVNLIVNAIHAMPDGGVLSLSTRDVGERSVEISVADTGPGLPEELMDQLFKPFVTRKKDGTGLGLWISRSIVERYGGDIRAGNQRGGGALMTVVLQCE